MHELGKSTLGGIEQEEGKSREEEGEEEDWGRFLNCANGNNRKVLSDFSLRGSSQSGRLSVELAPRGNFRAGFSRRGGEIPKRKIYQGGASRS